MIVAGFGFRASATRDSLEDAFQCTGARVDAFATASDKAVAPEMVAFGASHGLRIVGVEEATLIAQTPATNSEASVSARNSGSVAEAAALAAAGPGARLLGARVISADRMATCAIAQGELP